MNTQELNVFNKISKKNRQHITSVSITESDDYNKGRRLMNYTVRWDNGDEHTFQNQNYMLWAIREYSIDGYYCS